MKSGTMKKYILVLFSMGLLTGCARYVPEQIAQTEEADVSGMESETAVQEIATSGEAVVSGEQAFFASQEPKTENLRMSPAEELTPKDSFRNEQRTPVKVKGIYVSAYTAGNEAMMDNIIAQID